jgi:hypothetical protein
MSFLIMALFIMISLHPQNKRKPRPAVQQIRFVENVGRPSACWFEASGPNSAG